VRKAPSWQERQAAEQRAEAERRAAKGLPPIDESLPTVHDPEELRRLTAGIGGAL